MNKGILIILLSFLFLGFSGQSSKQKHSFVNINHLGIVLGQDRLEKLKMLYGPGFSIQDGQARCYHYPSKNEFIVFSMSEDYLLTGITISKNEDYWSGCRAKTFNKELTVEGNIKLGDTIADIKEKLGPPTKITINKEKQSKIIEYNTNYQEDPSVWLFFDSKYEFKNERLVNIHIHNGS